MIENFINPKSITIADMLRCGTFSIPWHQRLYAWKEEHVKALLDDLDEAMKDSLPYYFLGTAMLIKNGDSSWEINDGQQRIITYSLISSCLCKRFAESGAGQTAPDILRVLFDIGEGHGYSLAETRSLDLPPRIKIPSFALSNVQNFYSLICGQEISSNGKMVSAVNTINKFFDDNKNLVWLSKFAHFLLNKVVIVRLAVDKSLDINAIFETLNDRGLHLSQADLVKNYMLACFRDSPDSSHKAKLVNDSINNIYSKFNYNMDNISEYIRCYLQATYGFINAQKLFKKTKGVFTQMQPNERKDGVFNLITNMSKDDKITIFKIFLRKNTGIYILDQLTEDAKKTGNLRKINDYLSDLREYSITRPIVFALLCRYIESTGNEKKQTAKFVYSCMKILSSFMQRVAHVSRAFRPSEYEEKFANLGRAVFSKQCNTADSFFAKIEDCDINKIINDNTYIDLMSIAFNQTNDKKSRYIIRRIVEYRQKGLSLIEGQISVEHILPKGKLHCKGWNFTPDDHDKFLYCLGNLTLLREVHNKSTNDYNKNFLAKKENFKKSEILITRELCDYEEWTPKIITRRQKQLAKIACQNIWNFNY